MRRGDLVRLVIEGSGPRMRERLNGHAALLLDIHTEGDVVGNTVWRVLTHVGALLVAQHHLESMEMDRDERV